MTNRENYFSIIRREGYEHMPAAFSWCDHLQKNFSGELEKMKQEGTAPLAPLVYTQDMPCRTASVDTFRSFYDQLKDGATIDIYGVAHEPGSEAAMHMTYMRHPMEKFTTVAEMEQYPFPEFYETEELVNRKLEENNRHKAEDRIIVGDMQCTVWECAWYMRGMEILMMDMMTEEETATYLLDRVTDMAVQRAEFYAKTGADVLFLGDDIGMQKSIMMSEDLYCEWLKPRIKRVIDAARAINPNIFVFYHSCGYVEPFIPHFIDVGIDVLNPVQPECMDFKTVRDQYGDRISFHGTIGTQTTMPFGTPEEVRAEVVKNLNIAGEMGGLLVCPTHLLEPEVPWENIKAYLDACREYRPSDSAE